MLNFLKKLFGISEAAPAPVVANKPAPVVEKKNAPAESAKGAKKTTRKPRAKKSA